VQLNILRADPAGNITVFVLDPVEREERAAVAARIMELPELKAEQVGFVCPPQQGGDGRMEMMGGEFCGNATRAFGMLVSSQRGGWKQVRTEVSGCDHIVTVEVDPEAGTARSEMPLPQWVRKVTVDGAEATLVHLGGIAHLVTEGVEPSQDFFDRAEPILQEIEGLDAYGVIFLGDADGAGYRMTPLVKVPAIDTLIWEGSCGSGSLAAAVAQSLEQGDGCFVRDYVQPAGVIRVTVERENGRETAAFIGGPVGLDQPMELDIELD
jgi:diaminopimelate epimerase